ncbi:unnamed protein product [Ilex paraguariensis]|uniref:PHD-type domain-containing protein n=1 Tax=Ilex paraguariensis TaxID=185542 RepID=A0ABC8U5Y4_9AQUA
MSLKLAVKKEKIPHGTGTDKQVLREQIRNMLVNAGWTIDYRPRRNRDYLDAVYINPSGTAYWSIIKAYDALQKQLEEEGDNTKLGWKVSDDLLNKLTRQTRKKMEKEMKKKRRDDGRRKNAKEAARKKPTEGMDSDQHEETLSVYMKQNGKSLKGRLQEADHMCGDDLNDNLYKTTFQQNRAEKPSTSTDSHTIQQRKSRILGRCTLLVRSSDKGQNPETEGYVPYTGKRTLLSWLIDSGTAKLSEKVQYMNRRQTKVMLEGWITRDGIHCGCCSKILTVSKFEIHAGTKKGQPYQNIILESGTSLLQCQIDAWNRQEDSERQGCHFVDVDGDDPDDDTCGICGDGGDLICCDGCPSTFHQSCLDIQMLPPGDWHCPNCTCKFCETAGGSEPEESNRTVGSLLTCGLCEKKYHEFCCQKRDSLPADPNNASTSFCSKKCQELFDRLQNLLGIKQELEAGFSWSLIHRTDLDFDASHRAFPQRVECNSKLAVALSVMDECFLPIVDRRSGINLIHSVLYNCGSNFSRLNYSGFYTAILERGDEIISAASIRIHGTHLAEMPFIGTRNVYRRQGMCRRLLCAIEMALGFLKVERLIIPAIAEHMHTWTVVFGFHPLEEPDKQEIKSMNMLVFPGTDMLQKRLVKQEVAGNIVANSATKTIELKENLPLHDMMKKSDMESSARHGCHRRDDAGLHHLTNNNDSNVMISSLDASCESKLQFSSKETISIRSQSVNKQSESTADLKCISPSGTSSAILEMETPGLDPLVRDDIQSSAEVVMGDAHEANAKASCVGPVDSLGGTSARSTAEEANGNQNPLSGSTFCTAAESTKQFTFDSDHQGAVEMESKLHNIQSSVEGPEGGARVVNVKDARVEPITRSLLEISGQSTTEKVNEKQNSAHMENELHESSELVSDVEVASNAKPRIECNTQSSAVSDVDDGCKGHIKEDYIEPALNPVEDISAQNTTEEIKENENPVSASSFCGTDEATMTSNSDLKHLSPVEVEIELPVASEFDEKQNPVSVPASHAAVESAMQFNADLD